MTNQLKTRGAALRALMEKEELDGYIVAEEKNIVYFTGFLGGARVLIPLEDENVLYVHGVNHESAKRTAKNCKVNLVTTGKDVDLTVANHVKKLKLKRVGFDGGDASAYLKLTRALHGVPFPIQKKLVQQLRMVKDEKEVHYIRRAAELTTIGMKTAFEVIKPGLREYEVAAEIEYAMRLQGSDGVAFDTIVASGDRTAFPHGGCTDKKIQKGDLVMFDVGAKFQHYHADLTRTILVGKPSGKHKKIYAIVREAQDKAIRAIRPGIKAGNVDTVARELIQEKGFEKFFVHNLGHGVGLNIHEPPFLKPGNAQPLKTGNVVTVEPGIYLVDFGGIRIEDMVLVHEREAEKLTNASYTLEIE